MHYVCKMRSDKLDYITAVSMYCTYNDIEVTFCMEKFSTSYIVNHRFHDDNDKCKFSIGYDMIIGHELMV